MQTTYDEHEIMKNIIIEDLEHLGGFLDIQQVAHNIKIYDVDDVLELINSGKLPSVTCRGKIMVKLDDFAEHYAGIIDRIPKNGEDSDFYDGFTH